MLGVATLDGTSLQDFTAGGSIFTEEVIGLTGLPGVRGEAVDRPDGDGAIEPTNQYLPARVSAWTILAVGSTMPNAKANWSTLNRLLLRTMRAQKELRWQWMGDTVTYASMVRVAQYTPPVLNPSTHGFRFKTQVMFRHADPINYDITPQIVAVAAPTYTVSGLPLPIPFPIPWSIASVGTGAVNVTNAGDAEAWPIIDIAGPIIGPAVQNQTTGQTLYFDGLNILSGETLRIITAPLNRSATVGGVSKFSSLRYTDSQFFSVSAGATEAIAFWSQGGGTSGTTTMTVTLYPAYIT